MAGALSACGPNVITSDSGGGTDMAMMTDMGGTTDSGPPPPFELTSTAYVNGGMIPVQYECGPPVAMGPGMNINPPLAWTAGPAGTMSYAIVMRDTDFMNLVHWVIYDIPANQLFVPEAVPEGYSPAVPVGAHQAELQGSGFFGYLGPCSPVSINTYRITVHAMPTATLPGVTMASTENDAAAAVEGMSIASATLDGES